MFKFAKKTSLYTLILLAIIIVVSIFLRTYHYHEWLYFKMDQARDAMLITHALENGPGYLPLLGPRAGATDVGNGYLRLGPIFYYFQYLSGIIFQSNHPTVFAYPDLFFSIATIILLYFFLRLYFDRYLSILATALYAFSFIVIQYSRFAWNPNSLLFFTLLSFYGMLQFFAASERRKKYLWLVIWVSGIAIGSQLHFFGFFCLLAISALFVISHNRLWRSDNLKNIFNQASIKMIALYALIAFSVFSFIYIPVIASDIINKGENAKNFVKALSSKPDEHPLESKVKENINEHWKYACLIATSDCYEDEPMDFPVSAILTMIIIVGGAISAALIIKKKPYDNFPLLIMIWYAVFFILTIPTAFQLRPRFFIFIFPLPFILLILFFKFFEKKKFYYPLTLTITFSLMVLNFSGTFAWFKEQEGSQLKDVPIKRTLILKTKDGVTLGQLEKSVNYIYQHRKGDNNIYFYVKPEHVMPVKFLLYSKNDPALIYSPLKINDDPKAQYFAIVPSHRGTEPVEEKFGHNFTLIDSENFGQIAAYEISFNDRPTSAGFRFNRENGSSDRLFWNNVFGIKNNPEDLINIDSAE